MSMLQKFEEPSLNPQYSKYLPIVFGIKTKNKRFSYKGKANQCILPLRILLKICNQVCTCMFKHAIFFYFICLLSLTYPFVLINLYYKHSLSLLTNQRPNASIFIISSKVHHNCNNDNHPCNIQNIFQKRPKKKDLVGKYI